MKPLCSTTEERTIELSLAPLDYSGESTAYVLATKRTAELQQVFTSNNYSPIVWEPQHRSSVNFHYATGFCVDIDKGLTIEEAQQKLDTLGWNYALITTRSHTEQAHRFRIFLPFNRKVFSLTDYKRIIGVIVQKHFPSNDPRVLDGARQLFGSPSGATYRARWDGRDYDVDADIEGEPKRIDNAWTGKLQVKDEKENLVQALGVKQKTIIYCPFHADSNTSAFVDYSTKSSNYFISCSACGKTYWAEKIVPPVEKVCERFYSYSTDIIDVGLTGNEFHMSKITKEKFHILTGAETAERKDEYFEYLVKHKHIRHLKRVDHIGDMDADESYYQWMPDSGTFVVHYAPLPVKIEDNAFIEAWLQGVFGPYTDFIKQWMAMYAYSNYKKLPTLVLKGDRATGKNTFADAVMAIYPTISQYWHGENRSFTPEVQQKLLIADESVSANEPQYRMLKQRSGQKMAVVNQKFLPEYQVLNNINIIILSNEHTPIYVQRDEEPTSEKNNQFFVLSMPKLKGGTIIQNYGELIEERLGHYVRTELKRVYETVRNLKDCRYSIPTPITPEERKLFDVNVTGIQAQADLFLNKIVEHVSTRGGYAEFFKAGFFPRQFVDEYSEGKRYTRNGIYRNLKERGYLESSEPMKKMIGGRREYCFRMTDKGKAYLEDELRGWEAEKLSKSVQDSE